MEENDMEHRYLDAIEQLDIEKVYTLEECFFSVVGKWDAQDIQKFYNDSTNLLNGIFQRGIKLVDDDARRLAGLKANINKMYLDRNTFPANFYKESKVYKYQYRSCSVCFFRPTCKAHLGKDWSEKWVDNGLAGCEKYRGPHMTEKRLKSRYNED